MISLTGAPSYSSIKGASLNNFQDVLFVTLFSTSNIIVEFSRTSATSFAYVRTLSLPPGYEPRIGQLSKDELTFFFGAKYNNFDPLLSQLTRTSTTLPFDVNTFQQIQGINDFNSSNNQPSMSNNLDWVVFVRNDTNLWAANNLYIAQGGTTNCSPPNQPSAITGNANVSSNSQETYSVSSVAGATSYAWSLPYGYIGSSTSNSISVTIGSSNGNISVVAQNSCGVSSASSMQLTVPVSTVVAQVTLCQLYKFKPKDLSQFCNINGMMLAISPNDGLWKSDGTPSGTIKINASPQYITGPLVTLGNIAYFKSGMQIWKTDGTESGTVMVIDIPNTSGLGTLVPAGNLVFFLVRVGNTAINKLWKTDGTAAGTSIVMDIDPTNSISWDPRFLFAYNNALYFKAGNSAYGMELWKTDGTVAGTVVVKDVNPGSGAGTSSLGSYFAIYNNELYYYGGYTTSGAFSYGLWKTNGTDPGTMLVKTTSFIDNITVINGLLYFFAFDGSGTGGSSVYGEELWKSDGTTAGTYMIKDIKTGSGSGVSSGSQLATINGKIVFGASDGTTGIELWASDGTAGGTQLLKDINSGTSGSLGNYFTASDVINGYIYFGADNGVLGRELWVTDGTSTGTFLVSDIWSGNDASSPWSFHVFNGNLYFNAEQSSFNGELWSCGNFVGIPTLQDDQTISIYPNPGTGIYNIKSEKEFADYSMKIYNPQGQLIYESYQQVEEIDLSNQPKGVYFLQIKSQEGIINKKLILQ
jgi:ELWxxDGT repeat protein